MYCIVLQSLLDFPPILTNLTPASQPQAIATNSLPTLSNFSMGTASTQLPTSTQPFISGATTQPFILAPPPSTQFPVFVSGGPASQRKGQAMPSSTISTQSTHVQTPSNATPSSTDPFGDLALNLNFIQQPPKPAVGVLGQIPVPVTTTAAAPQLWGSFQSDPLAVLTDLTVPKDQIQPSERM